MKAGETLTDTFTVSTTDGTTHTVTVTLQGTNDAPVLAAQSQAVAEDGSLLSGHMAATDVDAGDTQTFSIANAVDGFTLNADGSYQFDPSHAGYQHLAAGQTQDVVIAITVTDSAGATSTQNLTITVTGAADGAVIGGVDLGTVTEDAAVTTGHLQASGQLTISDADTGEAHFTAQTDVAGSGSYGHFSVDTAGAWTYSADNTQTAIQQLKAGESLTDTLTVQSADGTTHTITVTLQGTNDAPVLSAQTQAVTEDGAQLKGHMVANDVDAADTQTFSTAQSVDGFTMNADGSYSFDPAHASYQHLAAGQTQDVVIPITVTDSAGATSTQNLTITVTGVDDGAIIGGVNTGAVTEDQSVQSGHLQASGQLTVADVDTGEDHFIAQTGVAASYGSFSIDAAGHWTYSADNSQAAVQQLKAGATLSDSLTVSSADGSTHTINVTLTGSNDVPVLQAQSQSVIEDGTRLRGLLVATDMDAGDSLAFSVGTAVAGFTLNPDGSYSFDPSDAAYQQLTAGQVQTLTIPITVTDTAGASSTQNLLISITGTGDAAVIGGRLANNVTEDAVVSTAGILRAAGQLTVVDPDAGEAHFVVQTDVTGAGHYGSFSIDASGHYSYTADNTQTAIQQLKAGQTLSDSFTVTTADGTQQVVTITINGTEDRPVLQAQTHAVTEDGLRLDGQMIATDADAGDLKAFSIAQPVDGFTLHSDGSFSFEPGHASYQHLAAGQTQDLVIPITVTDSAGATSTQNLSITITGVDDGAVIHGVDSGAVTEDQSVQNGHLQTSGQLTITDTDSGEDHFIAQTDMAGSTGLGRFSLSASGHWTYSADNTQSAVQQLQTGQSLSDTLTVHSADGTAHTITVTINGTNDAPALAAQTQAVTEGGTLLQGHMVATDADAHDAQTFSIANTVDGFALNADGSYSFDPAHASYQHLTAGQTQDVVIPVTVTDSAGATNTQNLTITVTGSNDGATIGGQIANFVTEDAVVSTSGMLRAGGQLTVVDPDAGEDHFVAQTGVTGAGHYGSFSIDARGHYSYTADNTQTAIQQLKAGQTLSDSFTVATADGTQQVVTISIKGAEDKPVLQAQTHAVTEDGARLNGQMLATDADAGDTQRFSIAQQVAGFTINADGSFSFDPSNATYQHLAAGQTQDVLIPITVTDSAGATSTQNLTITVTGTNDAAVVSGRVANAVNEDGVVSTGGLLRAGGQLTVVDPEAGEDHFVAQTGVTGAGHYGSFSIDAGGHYSYTADNSQTAIQQLKAGETLTDRFTVTTADGTQQVVTITINGAEDRPVLQAQAQAVTEDGNLLRGQMVATDADAGDTQRFSTSQPVDGFTLNADGSYRFDPSHASYQHLAAGQTQDVVIPITVTDHAGATSTQNLTITVTGTNDAAQVRGTDSGAVTEDINPSGSNLLVSGQLQISDKDTGENLFVVTGQSNHQPGSRERGTPVDGDHGLGQFVVHADGTWTFIVDNRKSEIQTLAEHQTLQETITVQTVDGTTHTLTVTITGTNDAPVLTAQTQSVTEDGAQLTGRMVATDVDSGDTQAFSMGTAVAGFTLNANGSYTFDPSNAAYQHIQAGHSETVTIPVTVTDSAGATAVQNLVITVAGAQDGAVIRDASGTVGEIKEDSRLHIEGHLAVTDVDAGENTFTTQQGTSQAGLGQFSLTPLTNGQAFWGYTVDNTRPEIQRLAEGQTIQDTFVIHSADGTQHTVTVTIKGSNDAPVLTAQTQSVTEDGTQLIGRMIATDVDTGDTQAFSMGTAVAGFTLNADGSYSFDPGNAAYQHLAAGQTQTLTIPVTVTDSAGATATQNLVITVAGAQDGAIIGGASTGAVTEDTGVNAAGKIAASGTLTVTDPDVGQDHFNALASNGHYGVFTLDAAGHWTYSADNSKPDIQQLKAGDPLTDSFTVTSADGTSHTVTMTITGTNDAPVLTAQTQSVIEDGAQLTGRMVATDVDRGDTQAFSMGTAVAGFTLNADGSYTFDPTHASYQHLSAGQTHDVVIPITVTDSAGETSTQKLTITVTGTNDGATITGTTSGSVTEDKGVSTGHFLETSGQLSATDVDSAATFQAATLHGSDGGVLTIDAAGTWHYSIDNSLPAVQQLGPQGALSETFTVQTADGTSQQIAVSIHGTIDAPSLTATQEATQFLPTDATGEVLHGQGVLHQITLSGFATDQIELGGKLNLGLVGNTPIVSGGSFGVSARTGDTQLDKGETLMIQLAGASRSATLQLSNFMDHTSTANPYASEDKAHWIAYDAQGNKVAEGDLVPNADPALNGKLDIHTATPFSYIALQAVDAPLHDAHHQSRFMLSHVEAQLIQFDTRLNLHGQLSDQATTETLSYKITGLDVAATLNRGTRNADGSWTVTAAEAQDLHLLHATDQHFQVQAMATDGSAVADSTPVDLRVTSSGMQYELIGGDHRGKTDEDAHQAVEGQLRVDTSAAVAPAFVAQIQHTAHGTFELRADGHWTYQVDNAAVQGMAGREVQRDTFTVETANGVQRELTVDVMGRDDATVIGGKLTGDVIEDGQGTTTGQMSFTDIDTPKSNIAAADRSYPGTYGTLLVKTDGTWEYQLDPTKANSLNTGDVEHDVFGKVFIMSQGLPQTTSIDITVHGHTDGTPQITAVIAGDDAKTTDEDRAVSGVLTVTDPTAADAHLVAQTDVAGQFGHFSITADGHWSYTPDNRADALAVGATQTDTFAVTSADGTSHNVVITLTGSNDGAVITGTDSGSLTEDVAVNAAGKITTSGLLSVSDADAGEAVFAAQFGTSAQGYGGFVLGASGHWTYAADNSNLAIQALKAGEHLSDSFTVHSPDGTTHTINVTINGSNDVPVIGATRASARFVSEDSATSTITGLLHSRDLDAGDTLSWSVSGQGQGTYGHLDFDAASGSWTYQLDNTDADTNALSAGQRGEDVFQITATDSSGATASTVVRVMVMGANDGAVIAGVDAATLNEDAIDSTGKLAASGQLTVTDPDAGQDHFTAQTDAAGSSGLGHFSVDATGAWTYTADNTQNAIQQLKTGDSLTDSLTVQSADGTTHTITVTLQGTNDVPVLQAQTQAVTEDGTQLTGHMVATDVDAGDTKAFSVAQAVDGFTLNADGSYSFDPSHASYQHLTAGQTQAVVIPITVTDSAGATSTQNLTITVTGANDGAVIGGVDVGTVTEDAAVTTGHLQASGQLTISDIDTGETHFTAQTDVAGSAGYGHFSVDASGAWTYSADNAQTAIQQLKAGESLTDTLTVASADGTTHTITVTLQGTNDAPVLAAQSQTVTEDGTQLTGHMVATDVDSGDTQAFSLANAVDGFTLNADGSYSFDPSNAAYQHLAAGQTQDVIIPITVTDSAGATSTQNLTITLTGSNDGPLVTHGTVATAADLGAINEDAPRVFTEAELLQAVGASDVDDGSSLHIVDGSLTSAHGTFTGDATHGYTFTPAANFSGQDVDLQFSVSDGTVSREAHGQLDITPVADKPVGPLVSTTFDDVQLSGQFADPALLGWKTDSTFGVEQTTEDVFGGTGKNQVLELVSKGASINSPNIYRELDTQTGQLLHVSFDASRRENWDVARIEVLWEGKVIDAFTPGTAGYEMHHHEYDLQATGPQSRIEFRVVGDDADKRAIIDNIQIGLPTQVGEVNQALHLDMGQAFQLADTDGSETLSYLIKGLPPGFTLTDGTHSVTIASVGQVVDTKGWSQDALALRAPQDYQGQLEIQVSARAEETANHQTATSDQQSLRLSFDRLTAVEDTPQTFSASRLLQLAGIRAGLGEVLTLDDVQVNPAFGHFSHNADGSWTFTPEANVSAHQVPLTLTVHGGAQPISSTLHLDITPVADTPLLDLPADGQLTAIHTDFDSTLLHGQFADPTPLGWHTDGPQGSEVARQDVFGGSGGDHALELISEGAGAVNSPNLYRVLDVASGQMARFGFDVSPRNSWAVPLVEVLWEGKVIDSFTPSGTGFGLQHHDYDLLATAGQPRLEIRVVGAQSDMRAIFDNLDVGVSPVAARFSPVNGDAYLDLGAQFHLADTDGSETLSYVVKGLPQGFTLTDGTHSITVTTAGQAIETKGWDQAALVVKAPQDFQGQVNLQVSGVAEESGTQQTASSPELSMRLSFEQLRVYEDTPQVFTESKLLQLAGVHAPAGQAMTLADVQVDQAFGQFSHNANGSWTFTPASNVNADDVPFTLTIAGGSQPLSRPLQLSIAPVNDAPVLAAQSQTGTEDGSPITGHMVATDVDVGDTQSFSLAHPVDGFTLNADGSYSFDPSHASYQHLAAGQTQDVVIPITVTDHAGATGTQNLTFTLTGTNDGLQVVANSAAKAGDLGAVDEDAPRLFTEAELLRAVGASDVDDGNDLHIVAGSLSSTHGTFTGDAAHGFTFTPSANFSGQQVDVQFSVSDGGVNQATFARLDIRPVADVPVFEYTGETHSLAHQTDFDSTLLHGQFADPTPLGWHTDAPQGSEVARQDVFGGSGGDRALEMISSGAGKDSSANFYRVLDTVPGQELKFSFDVSPRSGWAVPLVEVLWEGKVIDSFTPAGTDFNLQRHDYQLTATGEHSRLELRVVGDQSDMRAIFDKLEISDTPHLDREALVNSELQLHLPTNLHLADTDGSETLSYLIKGLPVGFSLTDGSHSITVTAADQVIDTKGWQQDALSVQAPKDFAGTLELSVTGRSEEAGNQQTASSAALPVRLSFQPLATAEDTPLTLSESKLLALAGVVPAAGEHLSLSDVQVDPAFGQFSHNADGSWTFTPAADVAADQVPLTLTVSGGAQPISSSLQLSITPVNDAPVMAAQTQAVTEDGSLLSGHMAATDADAGDTHTFSLGTAVDGFTLNTDGSYSFDPSHASYQHLAAGQTQAVVIPITVTDSAGATSTQNLTITLAGSNDGPLVTHGTAATAADLGAINEDTPRVFTEAELLQAVGASDVDDGAQLHIVAGSLTSAHGTFTGDATHGFTFTPAANFSGQDVDLQFSVSDGTVSREAHGQLDITPVADTLRVSELPESGQAKTLVSSVDFQAHSSFERMPATIQGWNNEGGDLLLQRPNGGANTMLVMRGTDDATVGTHFATKPGQIYELTLSAYSSGNIKLEVVWNGQVVSSYTPEGGWGEQSFRFLADSDQGYLQLRAHDGAGQFAHVNVDYTHLRMREPLPVLATQPVSLGGLDTFTQFHLRDTDGSETLSYVIKGLPVGFTLSDGSHSVTVTTADQVIDTQGWAPDQLHLMAPTGFEGVVGFQVAARSEEGANHQQGALTAFVPQALSFDSPVVIEDTPRHFSEAQLLSFAGLHAAAGVSYGLSDVQVDAAFGHFTHNGDGSWTFTPAANVSADQVPITLTVTGGAQPLTASLALSITPVVDTPLGAGGQTELTDFNHQAVGSAGWAMVDPSGMGWHTDHAQGVELGQDKLYGGSSTSNQIVSLSASSDANLYRDLSISAGEVVHFGFDLSARAGVAIAPLQVLWEGKVIDTITPASGYAMAHHEYDLVATGANSRLELRATGSGDARALIDNLQLSTTPPQVALVNHALHLDLGQSFQLADTDGSETLSYLIKDLPVGFTLSDGSHSVTATTAGQQIDLKGWQLDALVLQSPADFEGQLALKVSASAEEGATHQIATSAELLLPLSFERLSTAEDTPRSFSERELLQLAGAVPAPGQHLSLSDVQVDPAFGQITHNADGSWTFTPAANVSADQVALNLTVAGGAQPQQVALPLQITAVTDAPVAGMLSIHPDISSQNPGSAGWAYLDPTQVGWHTDHHEGVYIGTATRYGGADSHSLLELSGLASSPMNFYRTLNTQAGQTLVFSFDLTGRPGRPAATIEVLFEGKVIDTLTPGNQAYDMQRHEYVLTATGPDSRLELRPSGQGDARALFDNLQISPPPQVALVNHALHLDVGQAFHLADTDGSETISYLINGLPVGFTLSDGSHSVTVTTAGQVIDTAGWQMDAVTVEAPKDFEGQIDLKISARTEESATHQTVTSAELPLPLSFERLSTAEDTPRSFSEHELLQLAGVVPAAGEHLSLSDVQVDPAFGHVTHNADGSWTFTPVANVSADQLALTLTVTGGAQAITTTLPLAITPVADAPVRDGALSITTDFSNPVLGDPGWKLSDPTPLGWHSSEASGVEIGQERLYGGSGNNQILSLTASWSSNIYRDLATQAGQTVHVGFDLSARPGFAMTPVEVLWEGKVIDTISPTAGTFAMQHHAYDLVATGSNSRVEFRATGQGEARALFDNIQIGTPDHLTLGDQDILLKPYLGYQLADTDGSETLSYAIHGLPVGFTLTDGTYSVTVATAGQVIETTGWNQEALALRAPHDFQGDTSIQVSARAEEGSNHQSASAADFTLHLSGVPVSHVAVIGGDTAVTVTEDQQVNSQGNLEHFGQLSIVDPDAGQALFVPQNAVGATYGHYTIDQTGYWLYEADNKLAAIQQLKTGEHLTDTFTVHSADGTAQTITVTIQGQDDAPAFVPHAGPTQSDDAYAQIGHAFEWMSHPNFKYLASMMLQGADTYPFERALVIIKNAGISFISPDGSVAKAFGPHGGTLTEVPISEMIAWHAKGAGYQVVFTDAKASEVGVYAYNNGNPGMLSGRHPYTDFVLHPEQNAAQLTPVMHDVAAASGGAAVQGSGFMPPAIAPLEFDSAHVLEDNGQLISGFIEVKDADAGQSAMKSQTDVATQHDHFDLAPDGHWTYSEDNTQSAVQQLKAGENLTDTLAVTSADGTPHTVTVTIQSTNETPEITAQIQEVTEDGIENREVHALLDNTPVDDAASSDEAAQGLGLASQPSEALYADQTAAIHHVGINNESHNLVLSDEGVAAVRALAIEPAAIANVDMISVVHSASADEHVVASALASPIDPYLQMVGITPNTFETPTSTQTRMDLTLTEIPAISTQDSETDMLDISHVNHFENPLLDDAKDQHKDQGIDIFEGSYTHLDGNSNDDDLLHSALNDMHNQM
ncbi:VCBS domain-containing protein [Shewanella sp. SP1S2-7]|uniref:VCBS domain-containing protein n=1 Tax=Shewanella holmiensis TaxID=2952222 RepID=A0A9X2WN36_9GAMM|nr:VCBS domain-containing protein [Shewanella holmiensis]